MKEFESNLRSQIVTSSDGQHGGVRYMPYVFTESGISMLMRAFATSKSRVKNAALPFTQSGRR